MQEDAYCLLGFSQFFQLSAERFLINTFAVKSYNILIIPFLELDYTASAIDIGISGLESG
jgi:hypothetical protein